MNWRRIFQRGMALVSAPLRAEPLNLIEHERLERLVLDHCYSPEYRRTVLMEIKRRITSALNSEIAYYKERRDSYMKLWSDCWDENVMLKATKLRNEAIIANLRYRLVSVKSMTKDDAIRAACREALNTETKPTNENNESSQERGGHAGEHGRSPTADCEPLRAAPSGEDRPQQ